MKALLMASLVAGMTLAAGDEFNFDGSMPGDHAVPAVSPDPRVRWTEYPVDGLSLCRTDSCIVLPGGSVLWIPTAIRDTTD